MLRIDVDIVESFDPTGPFGAKDGRRTDLGADRGGDPERHPRRGWRAHHVSA
jgi:hypothetical protein